jgi:CxxC-x17-CxxC domain-containing protein
MGNFNRDRDRRPSGGRDRGSFGGGSRGGGRDRGGFGGGGGRDRGFGGGRDRDSRPTMHKAVCDGCNNDCEVPFRPTSGKPIYCSDCFKKDDSRPSGRFNKSSDRGQDNKQLTESINNLNKKLDQILSILQTPVVEKQEAKPKVSKTKTKAAKEKTKPKTKAKAKPKVTKAKKLASLAESKRATKKK